MYKPDIIAANDSHTGLDCLASNNVFSRINGPNSADITADRLFNSWKIISASENLNIESCILTP